MSPKQMDRFSPDILTVHFLAVGSKPAPFDMVAKCDS